MRLSRLDLTRYGKFTDFNIDFGSAEAGRPDLHVIYGPNEAGKSTTFAAYLDLLFGIEQRTRYAFLHPYQSMRVGALLELDVGTRELIRIKRPLNSLLDSSEQVLPEAMVLGELGAVDRDAYRTMFSLDDDSLEAGGESILASKGDLGQLLFSASAGLAHLSQSLAQIRAEADGFYRYRARTGELAELKARLAALKDEREAVDTLASEYARLIDQRANAQALYDASLRDRADVQSRLDEVARQIRALPRLADLRHRCGEIELLDGLPQPPPHWNVELPGLQKAEIELSAKGEAVSAEIEALSREIGTIVVDEAALAVTDRLEPLADWRARYVTADKDLPDRRLRLSELERRIASIVKSLGREGEPPASMALDARSLGALRHLIERRSGIDASQAAAQAEYARAEADHAEVASR
ncbi:AAA family ATPase, partial [Rhizobiaceae sp. 2RAB30]